MDIESLREIITAVQGLGGDAKEAFIWYLIIQNAATWVVSIGLTFAGVRLLCWLTACARDMLLQKRLREAAGLEGTFWRADGEAKLLRIVREHWND